MANAVAKGKKYAGQARWENDLLDIVRITDRPRVGKYTTIGGKAVHFDLALLMELLRRRESGTESDGLRSRSYDGSGGGNSEMTQTEAAALRGLPDKPYNDEGVPLDDDWGKHEQRDPVGIQLEEAFAQLDIAARALRTFERKCEVILNASYQAKEQVDRQSQCAACGKDISGVGEDRRKSGYGSCCYWRWREWSAQMDDEGLDQSHVTFQIQRRAEIDAEAQAAKEEA